MSKAKSHRNLPYSCLAAEDPEEIYSYVQNHKLNEN